MQLIDILHRGYALNSKEELIFFCKKLWLKPFHKDDATVTEQIMEAVLLENLREYETPVEQQESVQKRNKPGTKDQKTAANNEVEKPNKDDARKPRIKDEQNIQPPEYTYGRSLLTQDETTKLILNIEESQAGHRFGRQEHSHCFNNKDFSFNYNYLAVSPRFIEQTIRSLRFKVKGAGKRVIDMEATVKDIGSRGYFDKWLFREEEGFVTRWTMLFDRGGSMVAFHNLQDALTEAIIKGTIKNEGDIFYFRNIARNILFTTPEQAHAVQFDDIVKGPRRNILVVSDAGAARGTFNEDRVQHTYTMLFHLRKHRVAWLNPLPKERWKNSSASVIARFVNMFEPGNDYSDDLGNIVRLFKSKIVTSIQL
jgi:uncharacterized protein with von Willebrand factor type A (vWA) domain